MTDESVIQLALQEVRNGRFTSIRKAAEFYSIPRSTLQARHNAVPTRREARVSMQILSSTQEQMLASWCLDLEALGMAPNHIHLREMASLIIRINGGSGHLGKNWVVRFLQRNPQVKTKIGRSLDRKRAKCLQKDTIKAWFQGLQLVMERKSITAENIWNMDEIGTALGPCTNQTVIGSSESTNSIVKRSRDRE